MLIYHQTQDQPRRRRLDYHPRLRLSLQGNLRFTDKQKAMLEQGSDVIIATPGRLIDYVKQGVVSLHACEVCILDEADRMFDLGFIKDLRYLLRKLPIRAR